MDNSEKLIKFRKIHTEGIVDADLDVPALSQDRTVTDKKGFLLYGIALLLCLFVFMYYTTHASTKVEVEQCSGSSYRNVDTGKCINVTANKERTKRHAFDKNEMPWQYIPKFVAIIVITLTLCILVLHSLVYFPAAAMWIIMYNPIVILGTMACLAWLSFLPSDDPNRNMQHNLQLLIPIFLTCFAIVTIAFSWIFRKTLKPLTSLFQEAANVIFAIPTLQTPPIMITVGQCTILAVCVIIDIPIATSLQKLVAILLLTMTVIIIFWTMQIIAGFQCMVTAGTVASWYFTTFQPRLESPILRSIGNTAKFHVGTIALGTFLHPFVSVVKILTICFTKWCKLTAHLDAYSMKNGLVVTALHGQPFFRSARRARNLLDKNLLIPIKLHSDCILWFIRLHVLVYSSVISFAFFVTSNNNYHPMAICTIVNILVIFVFFETFESTIYTLLICYCEDKCISNNKPRLYCYMTTNLNDVFNNAKQERYKNNLILAQSIVNGNNYAMFV